MNDSNVTAVQVKGVLIIGCKWAVPCEREKRMSLSAPRVIQLVSDPQGRTGVRIMNILGNPKEINILEYELTYEVMDEELIRVYRENVSGLALPTVQVSPKVLNIRGNN